MGSSIAYSVAARSGVSNSPRMSAYHHSSVQAPPHGFSYHHVEQHSRPGTPSMTTGSSWSAASSVNTCEDCRNSTQKCCGCQSDAESGRWQNSELGSAQSPNIIHKSLAKHGAAAKCLRNGPCTPRELVLRRQERICSQTPTSHEKAAASHSIHCGDTIESAVNCDSICVPRPSSSIHGRARLLQQNISILGVSESAVESSNSGSEMDEAEDDSSEDGEDDTSDDDDWSGQNNNLEGVVLEALQGDRQFAALLIPVLQNHFHAESARGVTQKVSPWQQGMTKCAGSGPSSEPTSSPTGRNGGSTNNSRKRQRGSMTLSNELTRDQDDEDEFSEGDGNRRPKGANGLPPQDGVEELPRLACPFNKWNPAKYGIQHEGGESSQKTDHYRTCEGPGFKSIQRLKEHLKRKHYPVQCDRCYVTFPGSDRASSVLALQSHRQLEVSCERRSDSLREGIDDAQWVSLEKKSTVKKNQHATSRVEKWMEIWAILFPGVAKPDTPWYDNKNGNRRLAAPSQEVQRFANLFKIMLDLQVSQSHISFLEGQEEVMKVRVETLAQKAIALFIGVNGVLSSTDSSSARSRQPTSLQSGSYVLLSTQPTSRGQHSPSESRSTITRSYGASLDLSSTPTGGPYMHRRSASSPGPTYLDVQPIAVNHYLHDSMNHSLPNHSSNRSSYAQLPENVDALVGNNFSDPEHELSEDALFPMNFNGANFQGYHPAGNMETEEFELDDSFMRSVDTGTVGWEPIETSRRLQYEQGPQ